MRKIAKRFQISYQSLYRHYKRHLPQELVKNKEETVAEAAQGLVSELEGLVAKTGQVLTRALSKKHYDAEIALKAIARRERQLELKARLLGQLEERSSSPARIEVHYVDKQLIVAGNGSRPALPAGGEGK